MTAHGPTWGRPTDARHSISNGMPKSMRCRLSASLVPGTCVEASTSKSSLASSTRFPHISVCAMEADGNFESIAASKSAEDVPAGKGPAWRGARHTAAVLLDTEEYTMNAVSDAILKALTDEEIVQWPEPVPFHYEGAPMTHDAYTLSKFVPGQFFKGLRTQELGRVLVAVSKCTSTQTILSKSQRTLPSGTVCVTDVQTDGRGRRDNTWISPAGSLTMSGFFRTDMEGTRVPLTQHLICLAVVEALDSLAQAQAESVGERLDDSGFRIKWPNDVYHGSLKVGGVLVESSLRATGEFTVVFGVGLNLSNTAPTTCVKDILERLPGGGAATAVTREVVMAEALSRLEDMLRELGSEGFAALRERYLRRWMHGGQEVAIDFGDGRTGSAVVESIDMNGYMVARLKNGESVTLNPDMTRLDPLKGAIRTLPSSAA